MGYDKRLVAAKLRRWEKYLKCFRLPAWEEIPDIGLYMEQVMSLLKQYLDYLPPELKDEQPITAAAINNYVRTKVMPEPQKKRYYRIHISYLIMICTLKQSLSISMVQKAVPAGLSEDEVRAMYETYASRHRITTEYFAEQVRIIAGPILDHEDNVECAAEETSELIMMSAIGSGFSGLLAQKLLLLEGRTLEDCDNIEIV